LAKKPASKSQAEDKRVIVRDSTFTRAVADHVLVMNLGRDYELAFLQGGAEPKSVAFFERSGRGGIRIENAPMMTETVRVRISPESAAEMAMHILNNLILANQVVNDMVLDNIKEMIANAPPEAGE
jgi:hypothetical protein